MTPLCIDCVCPEWKAFQPQKSELQWTYGEVFPAIVLRLEAYASLALKLSGTVGLVGDLTEGS
jgi:hypothetical protein